jgi:DnaJ-class molecular chaperone
VNTRTCEACGGTGYPRGNPLGECGPCQGTGEVDG